ncbi:MAG: TIGR00341 family protein [bacterium]|nr:TIGR00341 family protein [bacterium]
MGIQDLLGKVKKKISGEKDKTEVVLENLMKDGDEEESKKILGTLKERLENRDKKNTENNETNGKGKEGKEGKEGAPGRKERKERKDKELKEEEAVPKLEGMRDIFNFIVDPAERTFKNYVNPNFWMKKNEKYQKIKEKEQKHLNIYDVLSEGAKPTKEYYILTILSSVIATIGLIQGATATIIGAMIVAPLMTPILGFSLAVVWGDVPLLKTSMVSIFKGIMWALAISTAIAYVIPLADYSREITSRAEPAFYDILVALASGIVGAYGYVSKKISNTLIGIAIAVALMPPLCVVGIGIGTANPDIATRASILFLINLVSIGLAGAVVFWWMEIHPVMADQSGVKRRAMSQILVSLLILLVISVTIGFFMYKKYRAVESKNEVISIFENEFPELSIYKIETEVPKKGNFATYSLNLVLTGEEIPGKEKIQDLKKRILKMHPNILNIKVRFLKSTMLTSEEQGTR